MKQHISVVVDGQLIWNGMVADTKMRQEMMVKVIPQKFTATNFASDPLSALLDTIQYEEIPKVTVEMITYQGDTVDSLVYDPYKHEPKTNPPKASLPKLDPLQIAEILEKTAEVLERDGWCQGVSHKTEYVDVPVDDEGVVVR